MLYAALIGAVSAVPLILGAWMALKWHPSSQVVGLTSAFGAGALVSAIAFDLVLDASEEQSPAVLAAALALGAIVYFLGSKFLDRRSKTGSGSSRGLALLMGATLDGIPESFILGLSVAAGGGFSLAFLVAVVVSNLPEGMASAARASTALETVIGFIAVLRLEWAFMVRSSRAGLMLTKLVMSACVSHPKADKLHPADPAPQTKRSSFSRRSTSVWEGGWAAASASQAASSASSGHW